MKYTLLLWPHANARYQSETRRLALCELDLMLRRVAPEAVAEIAKSHPDLKIVVCHLLAPTLADEAPFAEALRALRLENVWFDISAVPWNVFPETYPYPTANRYVAMARDTVGGKKLLWGSDLPSPLTRDSYTHLWDYLQAGGLFTQDELQDIYYNNAFAAYPL